MRVPLLAGVASLAVGLSAACGEQQKPREAENVPPAAAPVPEPAVPETATPVTAVEDDLAAARHALENEDPEAAANRLRDAAGRLVALADTETGDAKQALMSAMSELENVATDLRAGAIRDVATLNRALAPVEMYLAKYHLYSAREALARGDTRVAGRDLAAASGNVQTAANGVGGAAVMSTEKAVRDAREIGRKLADGVGEARSDVERVIRELGSDLDSLTNDVISGRR